MINEEASGEKVAQSVRYNGSIFAQWINQFKEEIY